MDNSVLYAGYQYDEETGLYYINARMYDPVTARFLQRDTYAGNIYDPLSLNLYTYCLNNPHKYVDPTGHFVITAALILMAVRIGISVVSGVMSAKAEYDRQVAEGDNYTNWGSVIFVGVANAGISFVTFGLGQGATLAAGAGAKAVLKHVGKAVIRDVALGAATDAGVETARQLVTGTKITNLEYDRITEAGVYGGINGGVSSLAGAGLEGLMRTRVAQKALVKLNVVANKGADAIKNGFAKIANKNGKAVGLDAVVESGGNTIDNRMVSELFFDNGERVATTRQIRNYKREMQNKGISVVADNKGKVLTGNKAAGFDYATGTVYIKKKAGVIDLYHEGFHVEQYLNIGQEKYVSLGTLAREEYVYSRIMDNSSLFNEAELQGATNYITRLRRRY